MKSSALEKDIAGSVKAEGKAAVSIEHAPSLSLSRPLYHIHPVLHSCFFKRIPAEKLAWGMGIRDAVKRYRNKHSGTCVPTGQRRSLMWPRKEGKWLKGVELGHFSSNPIQPWYVISICT